MKQARTFFKNKRTSFPAVIDCLCTELFCLLLCTTPQTCSPVMTRHGATKISLPPIAENKFVIASTSSDFLTNLNARAREIKRENDGIRDLNDCSMETEECVPAKKRLRKMSELAEKEVSSITNFEDFSNEQKPFIDDKISAGQSSKQCQNSKETPSAPAIFISPPGLSGVCSEPGIQTFLNSALPQPKLQPPRISLPPRSDQTLHSSSVSSCSAQQAEPPRRLYNLRSRAAPPALPWRAVEQTSAASSNSRWSPSFSAVRSSSKASPSMVQVDVEFDVCASKSERIQVCIRKRPLSERELGLGDDDVIRVGSICDTTSSGGIAGDHGEMTVALTMLEHKTRKMFSKTICSKMQFAMSLTVRYISTTTQGRAESFKEMFWQRRLDLSEYVENHDFVFDAVLPESCSNDEVYQLTARRLVDHAMAGGRATVFAYGQTGAGKTYTMMGGPGAPGLYLSAAHDIFLRGGGSIRVQVSFFEIYGGKLFDLLNGRRKLVKREDGNQNVCIHGLTQHEISTAEELMSAIEWGHEARSTAATDANIDSSRSHAILQVCLRRAGMGNEGGGKLSFIDLAGSERACDTGRTGDRTRRLEAAEINKSLLALKECIRALAEERMHVPFRGSTLTSVLKDSFVGDCRTVMIANVAPGLRSTEHTLNTLRYAERVKQIVRKPPPPPPPPPVPTPALAVAAAREVVDLDVSMPAADVRPRRGRPPSNPSAASGGGGGVLPVSAGRSMQVGMAACRALGRSTAGGSASPVRAGFAAAHKRHIQDTAEILKREKDMLALAERARCSTRSAAAVASGSSQEAYLAELDRLLERKADAVRRMRAVIAAQRPDPSSSTAQIMSVALQESPPPAAPPSVVPVVRRRGRPPRTCTS